MTKEILHEAVRTRRLVCDGAMGTQLMPAGLRAAPIHSRGGAGLTGGAQALAPVVWSFRW